VLARCGLCRLDGPSVLATNTTAALILPNLPHIAVRDGGHLIVTTFRHVASRTAFTREEVLDVQDLCALGASAIRAMDWATWINFQENGNWTADAGVGPHSHLHLYGRNPTSILHPYGEPLRLPTRAELSAHPVPSVPPVDVARLRSTVAKQSDDRSHDAP
jgi:diadenosine tetraphosphate (Ap4A) HIT family hydrolase